MNTLIANVLTLASSDAGKHPFPKQVVMLAPLLSSMVERLSTQAAQAQVTLHLLLPDAPEFLAVEGDPAALRRLLLALLHNAITYTPPGGTGLGLAITQAIVEWHGGIIPWGGPGQHIHRPVEADGAMALPLCPPSTHHKQR